MKVTAYVHAKFDEYWDDKTNTIKQGWKYNAWPCNSESWGVLIGKVEIEVPAVDESELTKGQVKIMRAEQQKIRVESEVKFQQIEESIQKMLCLEYKEQS